MTDQEIRARLEAELVAGRITLAEFRGWLKRLGL